MKLRLFAAWCALIIVALWPNLSHAARSFSQVQSPTAALAIYDLSSVQSLTYQITNTSTGGNVGERIYLMRFRLPGTGTVFSSSTSAPAGWTRSAFSTTSVTFQASSWANAIAVGGGATSFTLVLAMRTGSADVTETLRDMRASFTTTTSGPPFIRTKPATINNPGSWALKSLAITTFQITDNFGNPITGILAGGGFKLVMTVRNNSTVSQSAIVSSPTNPPTAVKTGTVTEAAPTTAGSPLALSPGASGTIIFTYANTGPTNDGTIYFTAIARSSASVTSKLATSNILAVSRFFAAFNPPLPACLYPGQNITVTLALTNTFGYNIINVTPTLTPVAGAPLTNVSGPTPTPPIATINSFTTTNVVWVYQVNSNAIATDPYTFSGSATGTGNTAGPPSMPTLTTPTATSFGVARGEFPTVVNPSATNAGSTNVELTWNITNNGCAAVNSVRITAPTGWGAVTETYSLVNLSTTNAIETWVASGVTNPVTFTAPNAGSQLPQPSTSAFSGDFSLVFATTPTGTGVYNFTVRVTDALGAFTDVPVNVTVNPYLAGGLNDAQNKIWREEFR